MNGNSPTSYQHHRWIAGQNDSLNILNELDPEAERHGAGVEFEPPIVFLRYGMRDSSVLEPPLMQAFLVISSGAVIIS